MIERIALIADRPKMAFYTLIAVLLIAAAAAACTFTGVKDTPWRWAQALNPDDITSAVPWNDNNDIEILSSDEIETFTSLMNGLNKSDFTENKQLAGGTPEYGLRLQTPEGNYNINQSIAPYGALEIKYAGKQWWIESDELDSFVQSVTGKKSTDFEISADVSEDIPSAVIDYARIYV